MDEDFIIEFEKLLKKPNNIEISEIYNIGIKCITQSNDIIEKEYILSKLIFLYPSRSELYYYMGYIFKDIDKNKSLMWFRICYQQNPINIENILDFTKILLETNDRKFIKFLLKDNEYIKNIDDIRIQLLLGNIYYSKKNTLKSIQYYYKLLNKISNGLNISDTDKNDIVCKIYYSLSDLYVLNKNINKTIFYLEKNIENYSNIKDFKLLSSIFHSYLLKCDYIYKDNKLRYERCKIFANMISESLKINESDSRSNFVLCNISQNKQEKICKIKIGYLSNSIFFHAVSNFIFPILEFHDKTKFEIILFTELEKATSKKYIEIFKNIDIKIVDISKKNKIESVTIIKNFNIDILIDLDGFEMNNRIDILSMNPAPIQITYIGYPNSTGLDFIKYRIVDHITDPIDSTQLYSEEKLYMPKCFLLFKSILQQSPIPPRFLNNNDIIILGSFNKEIKYSDELINTWSQILKCTNNTKLFVKLDKLEETSFIEDENEISNNIDTEYIENKLNYYASLFGVTKDRLIIKGYYSNEEYINSISNIDIHLDTFPYSGTTTTCNILYNSIPVITLYNKDYHAHCVSSSILINSGLEELVAYSINEYIEKTIELCNDYENINEYKRTIGTKFAKLMYPHEFINNYENLLVDVYEYEKTTENYYTFSHSIHPQSGRD